MNTPKSFIALAAVASLVTAALIPTSAAAELRTQLHRNDLMSLKSAPATRMQPASQKPVSTPPRWPRPHFDATQAKINNVKTPTFKEMANPCGKGWFVGGNGDCYPNLH